MFCVLISSTLFFVATFTLPWVSHYITKYAWGRERSFLCPLNRKWFYKHLTTEQKFNLFLIMNKNNDELGCKSRIVTESIFCKLSAIL